MGNLRVTIDHGHNGDNLFQILVALGALVLVASMVVPTAAGVSAGIGFLSTIIMWVCIAAGVGVAALCFHFVRKHYKALENTKTVTEEEWTEYCRQENDKYLTQKQLNGVAQDWELPLAPATGETQQLKVQSKRLDVE